MTMMAEHQRLARCRTNDQITQTETDAMDCCMMNNLSIKMHDQNDRKGFSIKSPGSRWELLHLDRIPCLQLGGGVDVEDQTLVVPDELDHGIGGLQHDQ